SVGSDTPQQQPPGYAQPEAQTVDECICPLRKASWYDSSPQTAVVPHWSRAVDEKPAWRDRPRYLPRGLENAPAAVLSCHPQTGRCCTLALQRVLPPCPPLTG